MARALSREARAFYSTGYASGRKIYYATDGESSIQFDSASAAKDAVEYHNRLNQL